MSVHREFSQESVGERILKIGPHLPKLLSNIKGYTFLGHSVDAPNVLCAQLTRDLFAIAKFLVSIQPGRIG